MFGFYRIPRRCYGFADAPDGSGGQFARGCSVGLLVALRRGRAAAILCLAAASGMEKSGAFAWPESAVDNGAFLGIVLISRVWLLFFRFNLAGLTSFQVRLAMDTTGAPLGRQ